MRRHDTASGLSLENLQLEGSGVVSSFALILATGTDPIREADREDETVKHSGDVVRAGTCVLVQSLSGAARV